MNKINIYTDGSHFKDKDFIGYGAYAQIDGKDYLLSGTEFQQSFCDFFKCTEAVSNPTAEMVAALKVLDTLSQMTGPAHIEIIADYIGVKEWCEHNWVARKVYIKYLVETIDMLTAMIRSKGGQVTFRHIRGHQKGDSEDVRGNNKADEMAKSLETVNDFELLINK